MKRGKIVTPDIAPVLEGITRDSVVRLSQDLGYEIAEEPVSRDQLYTADEVFVCGTAAECIALREIDSRTIGSGRTGPVTREIQRAYQSAIRGNHERSVGWLEYLEAGNDVVYRQIKTV